MTNTYIYMMTRSTAALVPFAVLCSVLLFKSAAHAQGIPTLPGEMNNGTEVPLKIFEEFRQSQQPSGGYLVSGGTNTYIFQGRAGEAVTFSASSTEMSPVITVRNLKGKILAREKASSNTSSTPEVYLALPSEGLYTVEVSSQEATSEGNYTLSANGGRNFLLKEYQITGYLARGGTNTYTFQGQTNELVRFSTESKRIPTMITLKDSTGNVIAQEKASATASYSPAINLKLPSTGLYTLEVSSEKASSQGNYLLHTYGGTDLKLIQ